MRVKARLKEQYKYTLIYDIKKPHNLCRAKSQNFCILEERNKTKLNFLNMQVPLIQRWYIFVNLC